VEPTASILPRLHTQLAGLPALLERVSRPDYDVRPEGAWSVTETVAHLARYHEIFLDRIRAILAEDQPAFAAYRAEKDPEWPAWQGLSFEDVMLRLHASRDTLIDIVEHIAPHEWTRIGRHSTFGPLTLRAWLEFFLVHEAHHLYTIATRARRMEA
jgi:uncharacterized damage-inducible protein DinB